MRTEPEKASLSEVHSSVETDSKSGFWKKLFAFLGPAYLVSVGYMDPGNWATDIAGGSRFGYSLIWVLLMSNLMALLLQSLSARLGIVRGRDLAQASRDTYPPVVNFCLYILAEIAIAACDLAEVLGMAIGLQLLFGLPLLAGVCVSVLDTFLLLFLIQYGIRKMEAFILTLVAIIGFSFLIEMIFAHPDFGELAKGFVPTIPSEQALYIAIGIIGATVMPHNLYLHSSLVQTRKFERTPEGTRKAIRFNLIDSTIALNMAFFVNSAILVLAASTFFRNELYSVTEIQDAYKFLEPLIGNKFAPMLFAIALIAAGQSSTVTGTLAGQIVMEGYLNLRIQPWIRRLITRMIAIVPALIAISVAGEHVTGELLIFSQVILSMQLGFAVVPLIHYVSDKEKMKEFAIGPVTKVASWISAIIIITLNVKLVADTVHDWLSGEPAAWVPIVVVPLLTGIAVLLGYIILQPFLLPRKFHKYAPHEGMRELEIHSGQSYKRIAVAVDFSSSDQETISHALLQGGKDASYLLIHINETVGAIYFGGETRDLESRTDKKNLEQYTEKLMNEGYNSASFLGYGDPKNEISAAVNSFNADLVVMGAHGHKGVKDLLLGTTVDSVRHKVKVPVLVVRTTKKD
jgi:manganese transport protein